MGAWAGFGLMRGITRLLRNDLLAVGREPRRRIDAAEAGLRSSQSLSVTSGTTKFEDFEHSDRSILD